MRAVWETPRHVSLLVIVLLAQLFLLAYQIKTANDVRLIRRWAVAVIGPIEKGINTAWDSGSSLITDYVALFNARRENERLQAELNQARLRLQRLEARASEADQLAALLEFKQAHAEAPLVAARVIAASPAATSRAVLIDRGSNDGLAPNMVVLTPEGVVGKVVEVYPGASQVLLITDRKSGVGAELADSSVKGVLKGAGSSLGRLEYIPHEETVAVGARVVTSGQDQLFPKGLAVGEVVSVRPGQFFQEIVVQPAAPLTRLEQVLVLAGPPETLTTAQKTASPANGVANGNRLTR
ncbi:MAG: rod shape-determining protein MreC [Candidatus Acidiferrales bacterium]